MPRRKPRGGVVSYDLVLSRPATENRIVYFIEVSFFLFSPRASKPTHDGVPRRIQYTRPNQRPRRPPSILGRSTGRGGSSSFRMRERETRQKYYIPLVSGGGAPCKPVHVLSNTSESGNFSQPRNNKNVVNTYRLAFFVPFPLYSNVSGTLRHARLLHCYMCNQVHRLLLRVL